MKGLELSIKDFRVKLQKYYSTIFRKIKIFNRERELDIEEDYQELLIRKCNEPFSEDKLLELIDKKNVKCLFKGDIGCGKSTLVKYFCYKWATVEKDLNSYKLIVYLKLSNLTPDITNISDLVKVEYGGLINNFNVNEFLFEYQDEILFIFDGLDEIRSEVCRENFYKINQYIENFIITSRTNSIDINRLYLNSILTIDGFRDYKKLKSIYSNRDFNRDEKFIKYILKLFNIKVESEKFELLRAILYLRSDKNLLNLLQKPLFLIFMRNNLDKSKENDYLFYSAIIEDLILEYNKNIHITDILNLDRYNHLSNEKMKIKRFIIDQLSFIAFENLLEKNLKFLTTTEVDYILSLGFLKSDNYTTVKENSKYRFINKIFQKYFLSKYIKKEQNLTKFKEHIEIIKRDKKIDVFAFLNISLDKSSKEYTILVKNFTELIRDTNNIELEIKLLSRTQIKINNLDIKRYHNFAESVEDNIKKSILKREITKIKL